MFSPGLDPTRVLLCFFGFASSRSRCDLRDHVDHFVRLGQARLEAIALRLEAIAHRLEVIALRLEAIATSLEAIAILVSRSSSSSSSSLNGDQTTTGFGILEEVQGVPSCNDDFAAVQGSHWNVRLAAQPGCFFWVRDHHAIANAGG